MKALRWIWKVIRQVSENDLQNHAAEMAYFAMMAVFPFFLLLTTAVAFLPIPDLFAETMDLLREIAPEEVVKLVKETVREVTTNKKTNLLSATLIVCVWMASGAMSSTTRGLNKAFGLKDPRHYARFFGLSLLMTLMLGLLLVIGIVIILLGPRIQDFVFEYVNLGRFGEVAFQIVRNLIPLFFLFVVHAGIYWLCPAMKKKFRIFSPGTLFSVTSWILVSLGFKLYLDQFNNYDKLYGSLGAVILCLVWFYLMSFVLLIGGQIDAVLHPEYKAPINESERPKTEPLPWKLIGISIALLILVPLGIRQFLEPSSFTPRAHEIGGEISDLVKKGIASGHRRFVNTAFTNILKDHVDAEGNVDYAALAQDLDRLDGYLDSLDKVNLAELRSEDIQALLLNLYNATALRMAAVNEKEIRTLRDIPHAHSQPVARLAGKKKSLDGIRDNLLRVYFKDDPRLLCALTELSVSGPKIHPFAFEGTLLDRQLDQVIRELLAPPQTTLEGDKLMLPFVFGRFRPDFEAATESGRIADYIRPWLTPEHQAFLKEHPDSIEFRQPNTLLNRRVPPSQK